VADVDLVLPDVARAVPGRGLGDDRRRFVEPIVKELPLGYAIELNRLIQIQMEGSAG